MRGFPQMLSTKQDYMNCLQLYPEQTKTELRRLLADRFVWVKESEVAKGKGKTDDTHRVIENEQTDEKTGVKSIVHYQLKKVEDENATLFRLGFTVKEVQNIIV